MSYIILKKFILISYPFPTYEDDVDAFKTSMQRQNQPSIIYKYENLLIFT